MTLGTDDTDRWQVTAVTAVAELAAVMADCDFRLFGVVAGPIDQSAIKVANQIQCFQVDVIIVSEMNEVIRFTNVTAFLWAHPLYEHRFELVLDQNVGNSFISQGVQSKEHELFQFSRCARVRVVMEQWLTGARAQFQVHRIKSGLVFGEHFHTHGGVSKQEVTHKRR